MCMELRTNNVENTGKSSRASNGVVDGDTDFTSCVGKAESLIILVASPDSSNGGNFLTVKDRVSDLGLLVFLTWNF